MVNLTKKYRILFAVLLGIGILLLLLGNRMDLQKEKSQAAASVSDRRCALEAELTSFLNQVTGISEAKVMITLEESETQNTFLSDSPSELEIKGVAVLCRNGEDPSIRLQVSELLSTLLDLPTHRIFVRGIG